jgi:hypothetical protein
MNMTGLRYSVQGLSLRSASGVDLHNCWGSSSPPETRRGPLGAGGSTAGGFPSVVTAICPFL